MLKRTVRKMRSEHGASLSMALLLFLVCTVVASIAITAGTAASGRLSQLRESEKSYYNVTSAAKLLADELDNPVKVEVVRSCEATDNSWSMSIDGIQMLSGGETQTSLYGGGDSVNATLFEVLTYDLLFETFSGSTENSLVTARTATLEDVAGSIDLTAEQPAPLSPSFSSVSYSPFPVIPSANIQNTFQTIGVTVTCNKTDETYSFTFTEVTKDPENNQLKDIPSSSVYTIVGSVSSDTRDISTGNRIGWITTVTWNYLYTIAGGA